MAQSKKQMRNLVQYRDLSDEEFEEIWLKKLQGVSQSDEFEERINQKLEDFEQDYDLSDLKINDRAALRALIQAFISLEDYEQLLYEYRSEFSDSSVTTIDRLNRVMSGLRADISKFQDDLNIKRKTRQSDEDVSVLHYIEELKKKARRFYEAKMQYIFCEECNMLLATVWTLFPEKDNKIRLVCDRKLEDGKVCGHVTTVSTKELIAKKGTNKKEIMPEGML